MVTLGALLQTGKTGMEKITSKARPFCTNKVGEEDGCVPDERVWCCAGMTSTTELKPPCIYFGPYGTTKRCPPSGTPMRYCCPFTQNPGPLPSGAQLLAPQDTPKQQQPAQQTAPPRRPPPQAPKQPPPAKQTPPTRGRFIACSSSSCNDCKSGRSTCVADTCCCPGYCGN